MHEPDPRFDDTCLFCGSHAQIQVTRKPQYVCQPCFVAKLSSQYYPQHERADREGFLKFSEILRTGPKATPEGVRRFLGKHDIRIRRATPES